MRSSSLQSKTVRPGLGTYSFYMSDRRPASAKRGKAAKKSPAKKTHQHRLRIDLLIVAVAAALLFGYRATASTPPQVQTKPKTSPVKTVAPTKPPAVTPAPAVAPKTVASPPVAQSPCGYNSLSKLILVSISQRHLWACQGNTAAYDSPVITGMENLAADLTPTGTYHIYSRQTNVTLAGSDTTGSWNDPVYYWMPFLYNRYGTYGFHDATWRAESDFGNINPYSSDGSHGCVELPLSTAKWLYDWVNVGTTVTIES